jgi:hypothetical protein
MHALSKRLPNRASVSIAVIDGESVNTSPRAFQHFYPKLSSYSQIAPVASGNHAEMVLQVLASPSTTNSMDDARSPFISGAISPTALSNVDIRVYTKPGNRGTTWRLKFVKEKREGTPVPFVKTLNIRSAIVLLAAINGWWVTPGAPTGEDSNTVVSLSYFLNAAHRWRWLPNEYTEDDILNKIVPNNPNVVNISLGNLIDKQLFIAALENETNSSIIDGQIVVNPGFMRNNACGGRIYNEVLQTISGHIVVSQGNNPDQINEMAMCEHVIMVSGFTEGYFPGYRYAEQNKFPKGMVFFPLHQHSSHHLLDTAL